MDFIAASEFGGYFLDEKGAILKNKSVILNGEALFMGYAGEGRSVDAVLYYDGQSLTQSINDMWEYYKSAVSTEPGAFMKAWLHWDGVKFDAYLKCSQDAKGEKGFVSHTMPYISQ